MSDDVMLLKVVIVLLTLLLLRDTSIEATFVKNASLQKERLDITFAQLKLLTGPCRTATFSRSGRLYAIENGNDPSTRTLNKERSLGTLILFTVPLAWGTFEPAVRFAYEVKIPNLLFTVGYYIVAATSLYLTLWASTAQENKDKVDPEKENAKCSRRSDLTQHRSDRATLDLPIRGGIELGIYLFIGNGLQVLGLKTVPSDRAAFLLQLTTIIVPLVQATWDGTLTSTPLRTWIACTTALSGVALMSIASQEAASGILDLGLSYGDSLIILAAFVYSLHCIRLGRFAMETAPLLLAVCKATTETLLSIFLLIGIMVIGNGGGNVPQILSGVPQAREEIVSWYQGVYGGIQFGSVHPQALYQALGAVLWTGVITVAYTITAQSYGQRYVNPTTANLIYTIQPIFTSVFAWLLLGETLGLTGYAGGALILFSVLLVTNNNIESDVVLFDSKEKENADR